jgi:RNA polymerase sigma factor (sigma-70 family)
MGIIIHNLVLPPKQKEAIMASLQYLHNPQKWSDEQLKLAASKNRKTAIDMLVVKYRDPLYRHALYFLKDQDEAYDIVQETFIRAIREQRIFNIDFRIKAWLFRVAKNLCLNQIRNKSRRAAILKQNPQVDRHEPNQYQKIFEGEREIEMMKAMELLSEEHREILILRYYDDLSYAEIAQVLDIKLGTVMSRLSRGRQKLLSVMPESLKER